LSKEEKYTDAQLASFGLDRATIPRHAAIIMDGNGRWAQKRGLPRIEGHRRGVTSVRSIVEEASRLGLQQLTLFCFSSENWKRPPRELTLLMHLLKQYLVEERREIQRQGLRFKVIGKLQELDPLIQAEMQKTIEVSAGNDGMTLCLAVNYGARQEITEAIQKIASQVRDGRLNPDQINEKTVADNLMTASMPDPDLVIRTASEFRISNFLLWQISYSELWVTEKHWPEFREEEFREALRAFARRDRRFGGLSAAKEPATQEQST
jgi:undecaprenyl diphosphate synthase